VTAFVQRQPPLHVAASVLNRTQTTRLDFKGGGGGESEIRNGIMSGLTAAQSTGSRFSSTMTGGPSERRLVTPITDTASLQTAIGVWCQNLTQATEIYGDISSWCVIGYVTAISVVRSWISSPFFLHPTPICLFPPIPRMLFPFALIHLFHFAHLNLLSPSSCFRQYLILLVQYLASSPSLGPPLLTPSSSFLPSFLFFSPYTLSSFHSNKRDTSSVDDMSYLINTYCSTLNIFNDNIHAWDVSSVTRMQFTFCSAKAFNQPLAAWDMSSVDSIAAMFRYTGAFNQDLNAWDVSRVTSLVNTFFSATAFNQALDAWDVSRVTSMQNTFFEIDAFNQALASWDVSRVTDMSNTFYNAHAFDQALSSWDVSSVTHMHALFPVRPI